jgi:cation diffusion facilitator CzcD-associated flavoprotein CzcO
MTAGDMQQKNAGTESTTDLDVAIVGAGYAGLYTLHHLRKLGFKCRLYDTAGGVGGTWYWNRYPGARVDIESMEYSYSFSEEMQQEWHWTERYAAQPELLRYLNYVAERFDLFKDIQLNRRVDSAAYDEAGNYWQVGLSTGEQVKTRFLIMATGILAAPKQPDFKNLDKYKGKTYQTSQWPHEGVDFTGKRVGIIGTGSSAVQSIPLIAQQAGNLTVFQRSANFCVPSCNKPMDEEFERWVKDNYTEIRERELRTIVGCTLVNKEMVMISSKSALEVTPEEREAAYEKCWNAANFSFYSVFNDVLTNPKANETVAEFVRAKIRQRVKDPAVAELLTPKDHPIMTKRLCAETGYFETYNRDNVKLVDIKSAPIEEFTETGLRVGGKDYEFDAVIFATGFDAMTGSMTRVDFRGRGNRSLRQEWAEAGPRTVAGVMSEGYPNMFMINGPTSPGAFFQPVLLGEWQARFIGRLIERMDRNGQVAIEPTVEAENEWIEHSRQVADATLFPLAKSWYMGDNVSGKPRVIQSYLGGFQQYRLRLERAEDTRYEGYRFIPRAADGARDRAGAPIREAATA